MTQHKKNQEDCPEVNADPGLIFRPIGVWSDDLLIDPDLRDLDVIRAALVGAFDFLGFGRIMRSSDDLLALGGRVKAIANVVRGVGEERNVFSVNGKRSTNSPSVSQVSDTFLVYSSSDEPQDVVQFLWNIHHMLFYALLQGMPMRGAVARGDILVSNNDPFFLGLAPYEALRLEKAQEWSGACLAQSFVEHIEMLGMIEALVPLVLPYTIPWKSSAFSQSSVQRPTKELAINWIADGPNFISPDFLHTKFARPAAEDTKPAKRKYRNTHRFLCKALEQRSQHGLFLSPENRRIVLGPYNEKLGGRPVQFVLDHEVAEDKEVQGGDAKNAP